MRKPNPDIITSIITTSNWTFSLSEGGRWRVLDGLVLTSLSESDLKLILRQIRSGIPRFLRKRWPERLLLPIISQPVHGVLSPLGWWALPSNVHATIGSGDLNFSVVLRWDTTRQRKHYRQNFRLMASGGMLCLQQGDDLRFDNWPDRVHLAMDGHLCWATWDEDTMIVPPADELPIIHGLRPFDAQRQELERIREDQRMRDQKMLQAAMKEMQEMQEMQRRVLESARWDSDAFGHPPFGLVKLSPLP